MFFKIKVNVGRTSSSCLHNATATAFRRVAERYVFWAKAFTKSLVIRRWLHEMRALVASFLVCRVHACLKRLDDACGVC